jgi:hypothetical protein
MDGGVGGGGGGGNDGKEKKIYERVLHRTVKNVSS